LEYGGGKKLKKDREQKHSTRQKQGRENEFGREKGPRKWGTDQKIILKKKEGTGKG